MDARRLSDGAVVYMKPILRKDWHHERDSTLYFSSKSLRGDRRNHCVPILDVLYPPDSPEVCFLVMPLLRWYNNPSFKTVGEALEFFRQLFEVLSLIFS